MDFDLFGHEGSRSFFVKQTSVCSRWLVQGTGWVIRSSVVRTLMRVYIRLMEFPMRILTFSLVMLMVLAACSSQAEQLPKGGPFLTPTTLTTPLPAAVVGAETPLAELALAPTRAPTLEQQAPSAPDVIADGQALRQLMLFSHTYWRNLWADGWVVLYAGDGSTDPVQVTHTQLWVEQPAKARVVSGPQTSPQNLLVSDGLGYSMDHGPVQELPFGIGQAFNPPTILSDTIQPYPLAGMLGTPLSDMAFPTALAQRGGEFQIIGQEQTAGRTAIVALWSFQPGGPVVDRMWVDAQTGILLRWINYSKPGGSYIASEKYFSDVVIDMPLPEAAFAVGSLLPLEYALDALDVAQP